MALAKYACEAVGPMDGLILTHADSLRGLEKINVCTEYKDVKLTPSSDLKVQTRAGEVLKSVQAICYPIRLNGAGGITGYMQWISDVLHLPLDYVSWGPTAGDVR